MKQRVLFLAAARNFIYSLLLGLFAFLTSCEIGLGASVDTERPEAFISESLEANLIIKGPFVVSGTCSDDREVAKIRVVMFNNETGEGYLFVSDPNDNTASMEKDMGLKRLSSAVQLIRKTDENGQVINKYKREDSWSVLVNEKSEDGTYPLRDGKYSITVYPFDNVDRKLSDISPAGRSIVIDNTAPLLVLSRPSQSNNSYGRFFSIAGRVADDSNVALMEIDVFDASADENAAPLHTIVKTGIAPSIDINAAVFGQEGEEGSYEKIYGKNPLDGTKAYKCKIRVYDSAVSFPLVEGEKGNCASAFYLDSDEELNAFIQSFSISDLYHILSGTYDMGADRSVTDALNSVREWLHNPEKAHLTAAFELNPENSPKFSLIGGYNTVETFEDIKKSEVLDNDNILIKVEAGRDGIAVNIDSVGIEVFEVVEDSATGKWKKVDEKAPVSIMKAYKNTAGVPIITDEEQAARKELYEKQGSAYTITARVSRDMGLKLGGAYIIKVTGYDNNGNPIDNLGKEYGFYLTTKGLAPTLVLTSPAENTIYMNGSGSLVISGESTHESGVPTVTIQVKKNGTDSVKEFVSGKDGFSVTNGKFSKELKPADFIVAEEIGLSAQYDVSVIAGYGEFNSGEIQKNIIYDVTPPQISDILVSPIADTSDIAGGNNHNVNGIITISGTFSDEETGIDNASMKCVYTAKDGQKEEKITKPTNWSFTLDTNKLPAGNLAMTFYVTDKAGNRTEKKLVYHEDSSKPQYIVDQETDKPLIIIPVNQIQNVVTSLDATTVENLSSVSKNHTLSGTIKDDDGIEYYILSVYGVTKSGEQYIVSSENFSADYGAKVEFTTKTNSKVLSKALPGDDGIYKIRIEVKDKKTNGEASITTVWESFVRIAGDAPVVFVQEGSGSVLRSDGSMNLKLKFSGKSTSANPLKIYTLPNSETDKDDALKTNWKQIFDAATDSYANGETVTKTITVGADKLPSVTEETHSALVCIEANNYKTYDTFTYTIDDSSPNKPVISGWTANDATDGVSWVETKAYKINAVNNQISVTSQDNGKAGLSKILYKYGNDGDDYTYSSSDVTWYEVAGSGTFAINQNFNDISQGKKLIYLYAQDNAGNISDRSVYSFIADTTAPVLTLKKTGTNEELADTSAILIKNDYKFDIIATDAQSSVGEVKVNGVSHATNPYTVQQGNLAPNGKYEISVTNGANITTTKTLTFREDSTAPSVEIMNPPENVWQNTSENITVNGTADDKGGSGVEKVEYSIDNGTTWTETTGKENWSFELPLGSVIEGKDVIEVQVRATDYTGNQSSTVQRKINKDLNAPVISDVKWKKSSDSTYEDLTGTTLYLNSDFDLSGTVTDTNKLASVNVKATCPGKAEVSLISVNTGLSGTYNFERTGASKVTVGSGKTLEDGNWTIKVSATDIAGKSAVEKTYSIVVDTTSPVIADFEVPGNEDTKTANYTYRFSGSITENGSGIDSGTVVLKINGTPVTTTGTTSWNASVTFDNTGVFATGVFATQGVKTVTLDVTDKAGNAATQKSKTFIYDTADPEITNVVIPENMKQDGGTLSFTVKDSYKLKKVTIRQEKSGASVERVITYTSQTEDITQVIPFNASYAKVNATDGAYKYTIIVEDDAGNTVIREDNVTADTTKPKNPVISTPSASVKAKNAINTSNYRLSGTAEDNDGGLGIDKVYFKILASDVSEPAKEDGSWKEVTPNMGSWDSVQVFRAGDSLGDAYGEGSYKLWVYSKDKVGNVSDAVSREFEADFASPEVEIKIKNSSGTEISDSTKDAGFKFVYTASDSWGLKTDNPITVKVYKDGSGTELASAKYTHSNKTITLNSPADDGVYKVTVKAVDKATKETEVSAEIRLDTTGPVIEVPALSATGKNGWFKEKDITVSGTATDAGCGIEKIYYTTNSSATTSQFTDTTKWTAVVGTDSWYFEEKNLSDTNSREYRIAGVDKLGNISDIKTLTVKIDSASPVISTPVASKEVLKKSDYDSLSLTISADVTATLSGIETVHLYKGTTDLGAMSNTSGNTYSITLTDKNKLSEGTNTFTVKATNNAGTESESDSVSVTLDSTLPKIEDIIVSPTTTDDSNNECVNGKITITATVSDNEFADNAVLNWSFDNGKSGTKSVGSSSGATLNFEVDTTELSDNVDNTLTLTISDKAGNSKTETVTIKVNQSTDAPKISPLNFSELNTSTAVNTSTNLFGVTRESGISTNNKIRATITDDDGLSVVKLEYKKTSESNYTLGTLNSELTSGAKTYNLEWNLPKDEGLYEVRITVEDTKKETPESVYKQVRTTYVGAEDKAPSVKLSTKDEKYVKSGDSVTVSGTFDGGSSTTLKRKLKVGAGAEVESNITDKSFNDVITQTIATNTNEIVTVTYEAANMFGKTASATYYYVIDNSKPTYSSLKVDDEVYDGTKWHKSLSFDFNGTWTDKDSGTHDAVSDYNKGSGITEIKYWLKNADAEPADADTPSGTIIPEEAASGDNWTFEETVYNFTNGTNYLFVRAEDKAGNKSVYEKFIIKCDTGNPVLTFDESETGMKFENNVIYVNRENLVDSDKGLYVKGTLSDSVSGLKKLEVKNAATVVGTVDYSAGNQTSATINLKLDASKLKTGGTTPADYTFNDNYTLSVKGYDKADNSTEKTFKLFVDSEDPVIDSPVVTKYVDVNSKTNNVNGVISIKGNAADNDKIKTLTAVIKKADGTVVPITNTSSTGYNIVLDTTANVLENYTGNITLTVTAEDRSGRTSVITETMYVDQSTDIPTYESTNATDSEAKNNLFGMGEWVIRGNVGDDDGVKKVEVKIDSDTYQSKFTATEGSEKTSQAFDYTLDQTIAEGTHTLYVKVTDKNDLSEEYQIPFAVDKTDPVILVNKISGRDYYDGIFVGSSFKVQLEVTDGNAIEKVKQGDTELAKVGGYYEENITVATASNNIKRVYTAEDEYGRKSEYTITYNVDNLQPTFTENKIKVYISSNDEKTKTEAASYWFNSKSVTIKGEEGIVTDVNLEKQYTISVTGDTTDSGNKDMSVSNDGKGSFTDTRPMNDGICNVTYTFKDSAENTISSSSITINVDTKAPVVLQSKNPDDTEIPYITLDTDTGVTQASEKIKLNFTLKDILNNVNATEAGEGDRPHVSGIRKVSVGTDANFKDSDTASGYLGIKEISKVDGFYPTEYKVENWELDFSSKEEGLHEIYVRVYDAANNESDPIKLGSFKKDNTAPVISFDEIFDASTETGTQVNKTITVSGTSTDENAGTSAPSLKVYKADASGNKSGSAITTTGLLTPGANTFASWSFTIDTTKLDDENSYVFEAEVSDKAENNTTKSVILNVDQNTDRPIITLYDINVDGKSNLNSKEIRGMVEDDDSDTDGKVSKLEIQVRENTKTTPTDTVAGDADKDAEGKISVLDKWVTLNVETNGQFSYEVPGDNNYRIWFKVTDKGIGNGNKVFTSSDSSGSTKQPKIQTSNNSTVVGTYIDYKVDATPPNITDVKIAMWTGTAYASETAFAQGGYYGGTLKQKAKVYISAEDTVSAFNDLKAYVLVNNVQKAEITSNKDSGRFYWEVDFGAKDATSGALEYPNDVYTLEFKVEDESGASYKEQRTIFVDNYGPNHDGTALDNVKPLSTTEVTGNVTFSASLNDNKKIPSGVDGSSIYYYLPKNNGKTGAGAVTETVPTTDWSSYDSKWTRTNLTVTDARIELLLKTLSKTDATIVDDYAGYETATDSGVYNIPVWFKISDKLGNTSYITDKVIKYNPDQAKPHVQINYPEMNKTTADGTKDYVVLGGDIRMTGTAGDNIGVSGIYVQFDVNGDGLYNKKDIDDLKDSTKWNYADADIVKIPGTTVELTDITETGNFDNWGIKAKGDVSWNITFNTTEISGLQIGKDDNTTNKTLNIRVRASDTDETTHVSAWDEIHVSVNNSNPVFGRFELVQYEEAAYTNEVQRVDFVTGRYISGNYWRLEGSVEKSPDGIKKIEQTIGNEATTEITLADSDKIGTTGYKIHVPVTGASEFNLTLEAYDKTEDENKSSASFNIKIDNEAPAFKDGANDDTLEIFQGTYGKNALSSNKMIQNSNGWTTLASKVGEAGSGFDKAIFYVERHSGTNEAKTSRRIYNVMESCGTSRNDNRTNLVESSGSGVYINEDGLPVLDVSSSEVTRSDEYTLVVNKTDIGNNKNIRLGGVVYFGGNYKIITSYNRESADKITVKVSEEVDKTKYTSASFVYGMVVNNSGEGRNSDGTLKNDDGDGMVESVIQAGSEYTWDVSFDSSNVPDGPAEIHVVVFDKAGKSRHGSIEARFSNNAPRITSVKFGTDLDGNGSVSASEETTFYAYKDNDGDPDTTKGREIWNLEPRKETESIDRDWLIRSTLEVTPEFVGGTAPFYYVFSKKNSVEADTAGSRLKDAEAKTVSGVKSGNLSSSGTTITFSDDDLGNSGDGSLNTYRFSFWDSTEETTIGVDSGACVLNAELKQVMNDTTPPIAYVHPFFWNGKKTGNNSVHWNGNTPLGHIELVEDLTSDITGATDGSSGTLGSDPKVSGTIVIRGTAYDETKLKKVKVAFDGIIDSGVESELQNSGWSTAGSLETNGYELTVTELKLSQTGHLVSWELKIDTSKISGQTGINKSVKVTAYDSKNNYNTVGSETVTENESYYATEEQASKDWFYTEAAHSRTPEANKKEIFDRKIVKGEVALSADDSNDAVYKYTVYGTSDKYQMDIVPYVTEVVTNLSAMKTTNPSVNSRTANGHYPVQSVFSTTVAPKMSNKTSEDVVLHGFNLGGTLKVGNISSSTIQTASGAKKAGELCFNVASLKSGKATITVNGIPVMNNLNDNDSMGTCTEAGTNYANCYNRTPNGENNNLLTDDIEFDVWEFNDRVAKVSSVGFMYNVRMMINQTNKILQYIFATSDKDVYIGNGTKSSNYYNRNAQNKDYITTQSLGFYVDSSGNTYGTWLSAEDTDYYYYVNNNGTKVSIATINGVTNNLKDQIYSPVFAKRANVLYHAYFDKLDQKAKFIDTINHKIVQNLEDTVWGRANNLSLSSTFYKSANGAANSRNNDKYTKPNNGTAVELTGKTQYLNNTTVYEYKYKYTKTTGDDSTVNLSASNAIALSDLETEDNSANSADSYVNLAVTKTKGADTDTVLAVWYSQSGKLFYSYKENAESTGGWSQKAKTIFGDGGKYCAIAVDAHGGVHIAAYVGKDLKYAYSSSYDGEFTTCIVDTNSGNHLTLDVALEEIITGEFRPIPVIGYYSGKQKPKFAKLNHEAWINSSNSVDSESSWSAPDAFTSSTVNGKWENSFVPVRTNLLMQEEEVINVGLWKNTEGKLTNSYKTGTTVGTSTYDNSSSETYGNGSSNGILCYITDNGSNMETAQMRGSN